MKISDLTGAALDWAVAKCELPQGWPDDEVLLGESTDYSTDWSVGGPIIEREKISVTSQTNGHDWAAKSAFNYSYGPTPLIAAMRCFVASKLGHEVDVPDELAEVV